MSSIASEPSVINSALFPSFSSLFTLVFNVKSSQSDWSEYRLLSLLSYLATTISCLYLYSYCDFFYHQMVTPNQDLLIEQSVCTYTPIVTLLLRTLSLSLPLPLPLSFTFTFIFTFAVVDFQLLHLLCELASNLQNH